MHWRGIRSCAWAVAPRRKPYRAGCYRPTLRASVRYDGVIRLLRSKCCALVLQENRGFDEVFLDYLGQESRLMVYFLEVCNVDYCLLMTINFIVHSYTHRETKYTPI